MDLLDLLHSAGLLLVFWAVGIFGMVSAYRRAIPLGPVSIKGVPALLVSLVLIVIGWYMAIYMVWQIFS